MKLDLIQTLCELIAIPSVNPMGQALSGPESFESDVTDYLEDLFRRMDLPCERQVVAPQRANIVARLDGAVPPHQGGALILFEAHQDTVPVAGMTIDPWTPLVRQGRIYGRGACDVKGGLAAMLGALARLAQERPPCMPTIIIACSVNEEFGHTGAVALTQLWTAENSIFPRRPDAAVVVEPTELQVVVAHKGILRWRCITHGRAAHSSQPERGENAIWKMGRVVTVLEQYQREVVGALADHPLCGRPTLSVGVIHGGLSVNTVADRCAIEIDRRIVPGESPEQAYRHVMGYVAQHVPGPGIEHEPPFLISGGLSDDASGPLADALARSARRVVDGCRKVGVAYGTDAATIDAAGVPAVVFGPGSIDQAHTADEWLALDQLQQASEILYQFGRTGLAAAP